MSLIFQTSAELKVRSKAAGAEAKLGIKPEMRPIVQSLEQSSMRLAS